MCAQLCGCGDEMALYVLLMIVIIVVDQASKYVAQFGLEKVGSVEAIPGILDFTLVHNKGAAFGIMSEHRWVFISLTIVVILLMLFYFVKNREIVHWTCRVSSVLIVGGGIGNLIDRIALGYVIDFIDISPLFEFAVFNIADSCVSVGGALLCVYILFFNEKDEKKRELVECDE